MNTNIIKTQIFFKMNLTSEVIKCHIRSSENSKSSFCDIFFLTSNLLKSYQEGQHYDNTYLKKNKVSPQRSSNVIFTVERLRDFF